MSDPNFHLTNPGASAEPEEQHLRGPEPEGDHLRAEGEREEARPVRARGG